MSRVQKRITMHMVLATFGIWSLNFLPTFTSQRLTLVESDHDPFQIARSRESPRGQPFPSLPMSWPGIAVGDWNKDGLGLWIA